MPNLYGVANPVIYPATAFPSSDTACPAGTETTIIDSGALSVISAGVYYPLVYVNLYVTTGATQPNPLIVAVKIGAGSDFASIGFNPNVLLPSVTLYLFGMLMGPIASTIWQAPGSHIFVTVNPTGQAVTTRAYGSYAWFFLNRAPDQ